MSEIRLDPKVLGLREDVTAEEIAEVLKANLSSNGKGGTPPDPEIEREAQALLNDPQLVDRYLDLVGKLGQVGEEANAKLLLIAGVSRITPTPIAITVKGKSASGKSTLVERVLKVFPPVSVHKVTRITPQSLFYLKAKDLRHSILYIAEAPGAQDGDYPLRVMISEGELTLWVPMKKEGAFTTEELRIPGPIAYIQTTTKAALHPEGETRWFSIWTDEGEPLTRKLLNNLGKRLSQPQPPLPERDLAVWQVAMAMLQPYPVIIPFAPKITEALPAKKVRVRRDAARFLAIIEGSALLHQKQREKRLQEGQEYIVARLEDYEFARSIAGPILRESYRELPERLEAFLELLTQKCPAVFSRKDVQPHTTLGPITVNQYLRELTELGHLEVVEGKKGQLMAYSVLSTDLDPVTLPAADLLSPSLGSLGGPSVDTDADMARPNERPNEANETAIINPPPYLGTDRGGGVNEPNEGGKGSPPQPGPTPSPEEAIPLPCASCGRFVPHILVPGRGRVCRGCYQKGQGGAR